MPTTVPPEDSDALTLYISYAFLPASQHAALVGALARTYDRLLLYSGEHRGLIGGPVLVPAPSAAFPYGYSAVYGAPLCITSAQTGKSLTVKFAPEGRIFPSLAFHGGDLDVVVPRWTAVAILTGAALTYGLDRYNTFLELQKTRLEIQKLRMEIDQMVQRSPERDPLIQVEVNTFRAHSEAPNIQRCELNGVSVLEHSRGTSRQ